MAQEREIATRIVSLRELLEIVAAIRALAASQMQQALHSLEAIHHYSELVRGALFDAAEILPADGIAPTEANVSRFGLIVFCAEHGLCGGFNDQPLRVAEQILADKQRDLLLIVVGTRGGQISRERGLKPELMLPMPTHWAGVTSTARRLATEVYGFLSDGRISGLEAVFARYASAGTRRIEHLRILPFEAPAVERQSTKLAPLVNVAPRHLFDDIAGEYMFAALENAAMQSFFSESLMRFRTMEAAHQNIENKTEELTKLARRLRQESVTTEILDLISGAQALASY